MIDVKFYRFNKRRNSTAIPSNSDLAITKSCLLRDYTSVINPVIVVEAKLSLQVPENFDSYNYVEIPEFNRFYFVDNIGYNNNTWIFSLTVDVLGSFRDDIRASSQFVTRTSTASQIDSSYIDTTYDTKSGSFVVNKYDPSGYIVSRIGADANLTESSPNVFGYQPTPSSLGGYYVFGVVSQDGNGLKYYVCTTTGFISILQKILTISVSMSTGSGNLSSNLARSIFDPIQFIKFCRWYPTCPLYAASTVSSTVSSIYIGNQQITLESGGSYTTYTFSPVATCASIMKLEIPKSPYNTNSNHRDYLNLKPYAELNLYMPVFGNIPLDTAKVFNYTKLCVRWITDYTTGTCLLELIPYTQANNDTLFSSSDIIYTANVDYGVDIPVYNLSLDVKAATMLTAGSWLENKLANVLGIKEYDSVGKSGHFSGNLESKNMRSLGDISSRDYSSNIIEKIFNTNSSVDKILTNVHETFGSTIDLLASSLGQVHSTGNPSSYVSYRSIALPMIIGYFFNQADENLAKFGAPCNKTISPLSTLSGFTVCRNSNIDFTVHTSDNKTNITMSEREAVIVFMNSGFYLE